jgi:hypothetical protein
MYIVKFTILGSKQEKIFYNLVKMRNYLRNQEKNPNFKLTEVRQVVV